MNDDFKLYIDKNSREMSNTICPSLCLCAHGRYDLQITIYTVVQHNIPPVTSTDLRQHEIPRIISTFFF